MTDGGLWVLVMAVACSPPPPSPNRTQNFSAKYFFRAQNRKSTSVLQPGEKQDLGNDRFDGDRENVKKNILAVRRRLGERGGLAMALFAAAAASSSQVRADDSESGPCEANVVCSSNTTWSVSSARAMVVWALWR